MLNHLNRYKITDVICHTDSQKISSAVSLSDPEKRVLINQIYKSHLRYPLDISVMIESFRHLVMLEEDPFAWYVITESISGDTFENLIALKKDSDSQPPNSETDNELWLFYYDQLQRFIRLIKRYLSLPIAFQVSLICVENLKLTPSGLDSDEVLRIDETHEWLGEGDYIQHLNHLMETLLAVPESLHVLNEAYKKTLRLSQSAPSTEVWCDIWQSGIEKAPLQPAVLESLFVVPSTVVESPSAIRRTTEQHLQKQRETQLETEKNRPKTHLNQAVILTGIICIMLLGFIFIPKLLYPVPDKPSNQAIKPTPTTPITPLQKPLQKSDPSAETLDLDRIILEGNDWQIDKTQFHTGDKSLKLTLKNPATPNQLNLTQVKLSKNSNLSFWAMSDKETPVELTLRFVGNGTLYHESHYVLHFESSNSWYLFNPFQSLDFKSLNRVDQIQLSFTGDPSTLWLDDFSIETIK